MTDLSEHVRKQAASISTTSHFETKMFFHAAKVLEQDEDIRLTQIRYIKILQKSIADLKQEIRKLKEI